MSDSHIQSATAAHGHEELPHDSPFTPAQWKEFQQSDIGAGAAVIVLMSAIFTVGLVLYTVIAFVVAA